MYRCFESAVGAVACVLLSLAVPAAFAAGLLEDPHPWRVEKVLVVPVLVFSVCLAVYCFILILRAWSHEHRDEPVAMATALGHARVPAALRPIFASWWVGHFALGAGAGYGFSILAHKATGPLRTQLTDMLLACGIAFAFLYAANIYLLLAIKSLTNSERIVRKVWRLRFLIDLSVAALAAWAGGL